MNDGTLSPIILFHQERNEVYHLHEEVGGNITFGGSMSATKISGEECVLHRFLVIPGKCISSKNEEVFLLYNITSDGGAVEYQYSKESIKICNVEGVPSNDWPGDDYPDQLNRKMFGINRIEKFENMTDAYDKYLFQGITQAHFLHDLKYFKNTTKVDYYRCIAVINNLVHIDKDRNIWCVDNDYIQIV